MQGKIGNGVYVNGVATKDAEYKTIGDKQTPLASFSLAINNRGEEARYVDCKAFGEVLAGHARDIKKGDVVLATGTIESREYNGKTYSDLNCQFVQYIGKKAKPAPAIPAEQPQSFASFDDFDDEELPFK